MNEQFSAFLDNEASRDETDSVINALLRDELLRESWSRQHWLRTTLRAHVSETAVALDPNFSSRVMQAIAADESHESVSVASPALMPHATTATSRRRRRWRNRAASVAAVASVTGIALLIGSPLPRSGGSDRSASDPVASTPRVAEARNASAISSDRSSMVPTFETGSAIASAFMQAPSQAPTFSAARSSNLTRGLDIASVVPRQQVLSDASGSVQAVADTQSVSQGPADHWSVSDPALQDELNGYLVDHNGMSRGYGLSGTTPALVRVATYGQETTQ
ncbi:MAG: sigma-E factor negative regulatory protein [Salinisphaera sp.]|jgi:negative regulator of sigma E activity|nr:sigma-E factor negative regulatory protein [Salinisphaera sp.]